VPLRIAGLGSTIVSSILNKDYQVVQAIVLVYGVAVLLVQAAVPAALLNVEINLAVLEDQIFVRQARAQAEDLTIGLDEEVAGVLALVRERIAS